MNTKRLVYILIGIVLISFGISALSLRYNDNLSFRNFNTTNDIINIGNSKGVNIGSKGLEVKDGNNHVSISWDGIKVVNDKEKISIGWDGIKVDDGNKTKVNIGKNNWFNFRNDLEWFNFDEERFIELDNKENISIFSTFVDIEIISEDRKDIKVIYQGEMKANTAPELEINKMIDEIEIKLADRDSTSYTVTNSNMILKVFIPKDYHGNIQASGTSSDIDIEEFTLNQVDLQSSSGDIEIDEIKSDIFKIVTTSGDIEVDDSSGKMEIKSTSGDIELDNKENDKDVKIASVSGDIYINFSKDASYTINGSSTSGNFKNQFPMTVDINNLGGGKKFEGLVGNGENSMEIQTTSGDVKFKME